MSSCRQILVQLALPLLMFISYVSLAQAQTSDDPQQYEQVTFIVLESYFPYSFVDGQGEVSGVIVDYAELLSQQYDIAVRYHVVESPQQAYQALRERLGDIFPFELSNSLSQTSNLVSQAYFPLQQALIYGSESNYKPAKQAGNYTVAFVESSLDKKVLESELPEAVFRSYETVIDALRDLEQGNVNAVLTDPVSGMELAHRSGIKGLTVLDESNSLSATQAVMRFRQQDKALKHLIDRFLNGISPNDKNKIASKWLSFSPFRESISGVVSYGVPPYRYPASPGMGIEHDVLQATFNAMGLLLGELARLPEESARQVYQDNQELMFQSGLESREGEGLLSDPLFEVEYVSVSLAANKQPLEESTGITLGVWRYQEDALDNNALSTITGRLSIGQTVSIDDMQIGLSMLRAEEIDALIVDRRTFEWMNNNVGYNDNSDLVANTEYAIKVPIYVELKSK